MSKFVPYFSVMSDDQRYIKYDINTDNLLIYETERAAQINCQEGCKVVRVWVGSDNATGELEKLRAENEELKALQEDSTNMILALQNAELRAEVAELKSAILSVNRGNQHLIMIGDDPCFWQRKEWVDWIVDLAKKTSSESQQ